MKQVEFIVNGHKLKGTLILPEKLLQHNPAILFVHGWTSEKMRSYQYANALASLGYVCFLFDMQGHGESEGDIHTATTKEFFDDVLAAYDYLAVLDGVDKQNISVIGSSFGSYLSSILTTRRQVVRLALRVPADYPNELFEQSKMKTSGGRVSIMGWRKQPKKSNETYALDALAHFSGDVLIIESEKDDIVPHETIQNYIHAIQDKDKLSHIVIKNAPHSIKDGPFKNETERVLSAWFSKWK